MSKIPPPLPDRLICGFNDFQTIPVRTGNFEKDYNGNMAARIGPVEAAARGVPEGCWLYDADPDGFVLCYIWCED